MWSPHTVTLTVQIERVQKLALKIVSGEWNTGYTALLTKFQIPTLQRRRSELSLCLLFKILTSECFFPEGLIVRKPPSSYDTRSSRRLQIIQSFVKTSSHLNSFIPNTVSLWNFLPSRVTHCSTLSSFKLLLSSCNF